MTGRARGVTLPELVLSSAIALIILGGLGLLIRQTASGVKSISRATPLQRDTDVATKLIQFDLMAASRGSFMNMLPDPGFETMGAFLSTATVPTDAWTLAPYKMDPVFSSNTVIGHLTKDDRRVRFGRASLVLTSYGKTYSAQSPIFTLQPGVYVFGGWIDQDILGLPRQAAIEILGGPNDPPDTVIYSTGISSEGWQMVAATFTLTATQDVVVRLTNVEGPPRVASMFFDNVFLMPMAQQLTPGDGRRIEFQRMNSVSGEFETMRYTLEAESTGGKLVRELVASDGSVRSAGAAAGRVSSLTVAWDGGLSFLQEDRGLPPLTVRVVCRAADTPLETLTADMTIAPSVP